MNPYRNLMKKSVLLSSIPAETIHSCLQDGSFSISTYGKNNIVHFSGELCSKLEIILSGKVGIERIDESGNLMSIAEFFSDEILGGNLLFSKRPYYPLMVTAKRPTVILSIHKERLFKLFGDNPVFLRRYLEFVADHTVILGNRIQHYVNKTIRQCILNDLSFERQKQNSHRIQLPVTKKAWAERMGVCRTSLSRELAKMREEGLIRYDAKTIELLFTV
ncbi:MAG: Crp/Fnr family transcriptional regulator [Christensenellales bacterium]|jgi:CRP-like cAMP-binding protein